jgi:hypothetical protein
LGAFRNRGAFPRTVCTALFIVEVVIDRRDIKLARGKSPHRGRRNSWQYSLGGIESVAAFSGAQDP